MLKVLHTLAVILGQGPESNAALAAATARSTSTASAAGTSIVTWKRRIWGQDNYRGEKGQVMEMDAAVAAVWLNYVIEP